MEFVSDSEESRILGAMKNRSRLLVQLVLLLLLFLFAGCAEDAERSSGVAAIRLGADPAATIIELFAEPDRFVRTENLIAILRAIPADESYIFEEALNGLTVPHRELDRVLIITAWAKVDPMGATKWAKNKERVDIVKNAMFGEAVYQWAFQDIDSLLADMEMAILMAVGTHSAMLRSLIAGWFDSGSPNLETYIRDMTPQSMDRQRATSVYIALKAKRDGPAATVEWAKNVAGDPDYMLSVYSRTAAEIIMIEPQLILDWCVEACRTPNGKDMTHFIAAAWVEESPVEAMDFIVSQPNEIGVRTGVRAAYRKFIRDDEDGALTWMESSTEEQRHLKVFEGAIGMYVNRVSAAGNPLLALEWLEYIEDEKSKAMGLKRILRRWLRMHEDVAEEWMAQSSMTEETKEETRQASLPPGANMKLH